MLKSAKLLVPICVLAGADVASARQACEKLAEMHLPYATITSAAMIPEGPYPKWRTTVGRATSTTPPVSHVLAPQAHGSGRGSRSLPYPGGVVALMGSLSPYQAPRRHCCSSRAARSTLQ